MAEKNKAVEGAVLQMFIPITKAEETADGKHMVYGRASLEETDRDGEINDYAASKPYIQDWSDSQKAASGGKSLGNVREQHSRVSAGIVTDLNFDDAQKSVSVGTECVDDSTWNKITKGALTGFSWGGQYAKVWKDAATKATRFAVKPAELSYVDRPASPGATFQLVKSDGTAETVKFAEKSAREILAEAKALLERIGKPEPAAKAQQVEKCMYHVASLAQSLSDLDCLARSMQSEEDYEQDDSTTARELSALVGQIGELLVAYAEEEVEELQARAAQKGAGMTITAEDLEKAAKSHHKVKAAFHAAMAKHHQSIADQHEKMATHHNGMHAGAGDGAADKAEQDRLEKERVEAAKAEADRLAKAAAGGDPLAKAVAAQGDQIGELAKAVANVTEAFGKFLEAPAAPKATVNPGGRPHLVTKDQDGGGNEEGYEKELAKAQAITDPTQRADAVAKVTLKYGARAV